MSTIFQNKEGTITSDNFKISKDRETITIKLPKELSEHLKELDKELVVRQELNLDIQTVYMF